MMDVFTFIIGFAVGFVIGIVFILVAVGYFSGLYREDLSGTHEITINRG
ncbi:hypothetical protein [Chryseobacterium sp. 6424]|nr:hypothetical protein [Chryseobacterium sp. 6424]